VVGRDTIFNHGIKDGLLAAMTNSHKITVEVSADLLQKALEASGAGIAQTVRTGLELVAASGVYRRLRQLRGKARFSRSFVELKFDRWD